MSTLWHTPERRVKPDLTTAQNCSLPVGLWILLEGKLTIPAERQNQTQGDEATRI